MGYMQPTIQEVLLEIETLSRAEGEHSETYASGAIAALLWAFSGVNKPSLHTPLYLKKETNGTT